MKQKGFNLPQWVLENPQVWKNHHLMTLASDDFLFACTSVDGSLSSVLFERLSRVVRIQWRGRRCHTIEAFQSM
jgi:hypothetical protein